jgi:drug/metabolite transporter (DMT)-like permease
MWSTLAKLTTLTLNVPKFQLLAMVFTISFLLGLSKWLVRRERILDHLRQPLIVWMIGLMGIFGFHFFYFTALRSAPPVEASLISYLWPLLIVLFSAWLPGQSLRWWHIVGALSGLFGTALLLINNDKGESQAGYVGYVAAAACALIWSSYSVLSRWKGNVPTDAIGGFCGISALLAFVCHLLLRESTQWPQGSEWLAIVGLGIGPMGIAFFAWDYGVKRGHIRALGAFSYIAPLLSTFLLIYFGAPATVIVGLACLLIVGGAVLGGLDLLGVVHKERAEVVDSLT